ncbi:GcrA family cell cycle regulator [Xanthobacter sediminis]
MGAGTRGLVKWAAAEDEVLRRGIAAGQSQVDTLAALRAAGFRRNLQQLRDRVRRLGLRWPDAPKAWTPAQVALAIESYGAGDSAGTIAARLEATGRPTTRNAVCGLLDRLVQSGRLVRRGHVADTPPRPARERRPGPEKAPRPQAAPVALAPDAPTLKVKTPAPPRPAPAGGVLLMDVTDGCRWPVADEGADMRVCAGTAMAGLPYCRAHMALAYVPGTAMRPRAPRGGASTGRADRTPDLVEVLAGGEGA